MNVEERLKPPVSCLFRIENSPFNWVRQVSLPIHAKHVVCDQKQSIYLQWAREISRNWWDYVRDEDTCHHCVSIPTQYALGLRAANTRIQQWHKNVMRWFTAIVLRLISYPVELELDLRPVYHLQVVRAMNKNITLPSLTSCHWPRPICFGKLDAWTPLVQLSHSHSDEKLILCW